MKDCCKYELIQNIGRQQVVAARPGFAQGLRDLGIRFVVPRRQTDHHIG